MLRRLCALGILGLAACSAEADETAAKSEDPIRWDVTSTVMGNPPNFAQMSNGSLMTVVSRAAGQNTTRGLGDGRGAKAGALVEMYWPHYTNDNLWDSYVGLKTRGTNLRWGHVPALISGNASISAALV